MENITAVVNKRKLHHWLRVVQRLKLWQLIVVFLLMCFVSAYLLRQNNLGMVAMREAVKEADQEGTEVQAALLDLQKYVSSHMNAGLGEGVYLEQTYQRAYDLAIQEASKATNPNSAVYQQASIECRQRFQGGVASFRNDYVTCVIDRVSALGGAQDPLTSLKTPDPALYRYNFVSPLWSPDLAGFSTLITVLLLIVILVRILFTQIAYFVLKHRHKT